MKVTGVVWAGILAAACACAAEPIRWFDGTWDASGAPKGKLLSGNPGWFGERTFTEIDYEYEKGPTWLTDISGNTAGTFGRRLLRGNGGPVDWKIVACRGGEPIVAVFDFKRARTFTEVDVMSEYCTNATGFVEFSDDKAAWRAREAFRTVAAITRVRLAAEPRGRYMRLSFRAEPNAVTEWPSRKLGCTYLDEVLVWGDPDAPAAVKGDFMEIPLWDALSFSNVAAGVVSILPMAIPHLAAKPSGGTPDEVALTMARNETETRYFAVVNGTGAPVKVGMTPPDFGEGVSAELLVGGVLPVTPPKRKLSRQEMIQLVTNDENGINKEDAGKLDVMPFFFAHARGWDGFRRRYLANARQVAGFPDAVPLEPGQGCVVMLRVTTAGAAAGWREGKLVAGKTALPMRVNVVDLTLPAQSMWIYAYEPFSRQYPFESASRVRTDVARYAGVGATTVKRLPEPGTKEADFFGKVPNASVGCETWCEEGLYRKVTNGKFDELTEAERKRIVECAAKFHRRGRELGLPNSRICAFLPDEPGPTNARSVMGLARLVKESVPALMLHCDPLFFKGGGKGFCATKEIVDALLPEYNRFVDISCPIGYISTREDLMESLWLKPHAINAMYNHPAGKTGREMVYTCRRNGFNGFAYYCYYRPNGSDAWDIGTWGVLNFDYQTVFPLEGDVALTPLYETLREASEDSRMLDALAAAGKDDVLRNVLDRSVKAWDRTHFQYMLKEDRNAEDILALRETILGAFAGKSAKAGDYPVRAADMTNVTVTGGFWLPRFETNRIVTVWADLEKCELARIPNFTNAARRLWGTFKGIPFDDSDVFKVIEGAAYTLATHPDKKLEAYMDNLIGEIARAQEPDGYLYTARTLGFTYTDKNTGKPTFGMMGPTRWSRCGSSHELYNVGHMYEAAVAYYEATGKRTLLDVAIRSADLVDRTFGLGPTQLKIVPGHEEIELGLVKLYRATGEVRYLKLAKRFLDMRGRKDLRDLWGAAVQDHMPVTKQREALGHAVRAGYLYCGMADVAALTGEHAYVDAIDALWENVVGRKLHLNGGIGAHRHVVYADKSLGAAGEAFGENYDLPNENAYLETCAAIANALWNQRLFLATGDAKYVDVLERVIYNGFLSGISMSGDEFFYPNPMTSTGGYARSKWFGCSCCPVNVVRFIPQIAQFAYASAGDAAFVNLFVESDAALRLKGGSVKLSQRTAYPWKGASEISVTPAADGQEFTLNVRVPGWCVGRPVPSDLYTQTVPGSAGDFKVSVNGQQFAFTPQKGYCAIRRRWKAGDRVEVSMNMPVRRIKAHDAVAADRGRLAVERGPIVWCAEGADNGGKARNLVLAADARFADATVDVCGVRLPALVTEGRTVRRGLKTSVTGESHPMKLIPYFAWCHRGAGEMQTWFPVSADVLRAGAADLETEMSHLNDGESYSALYDGVTPPNGAAFDPRQKRCTFWPHLGTEEWVCVTLPAAESVTGVDVYWFDDDPVGRCRVPASWKVQVKPDESAEWQDAATNCPIVKGGWSCANLPAPRSALKIRLLVTLKPGVSSGLCELRLR